MSTENTTTDKAGVLAEGILTSILLACKVPSKYAGGIASALWVAITAILGTICATSCTATSTTTVTTNADGTWQLEYSQSAPVVPATGTVTLVDGDAK
ncbi:MAG: hypothetical protein R3Y56_02625 [Akkermansia sp.]